MLSYFSLVSQILTLVVSFVFIKKNKSTFTYLLTTLLVLFVSVEIIGTYKVSVNASNFIYYHYFTLIEYSLISIMYLRFIKKKSIKYLAIIFYVCFLISWLIVFKDNNFYKYTVIIESIGIAIYIFIYLRSILMSDEILNYKNKIPFWISIGFLVFYLPSIPFFVLWNYMIDRGLFFILDILAILMHLFIIYGLITCKKEEKY